MRTPPLRPSCPKTWYINFVKVLPSDLKTFSFLVFFSLLIFLFDILGFLNFPKTVIQTFTVPIQYGLYQGGKVIGNQFEFISNARTAVKENKALKILTKKPIISAKPHAILRLAEKL